MASRSEKNKNALRDRHQVILAEMLREDANRLCADCQAKGPRWASWNIGVFVCIRCAGIHRNLGVHISKVKSVNLDSWTPEQIDKIVEWGNQRAKDVYECYLPNDFCRPQGDSAMETFIRSKYERKLYMVKGDITKVGRNTTKSTKVIAKSDEKTSKPVKAPLKIERPAASSATSATANPLQSSQFSSKQAPSPPAAVMNRQHPSAAASTSKVAAVADLLSMDDINQPVPGQQTNNGQTSSLDLFSLNSAPTDFGQVPQASQLPQQDLFSSPSATSAASSSAGNEQSLLPEDAAPAKSTKESIMSLFSQGNQQQQQPSAVYGVPGGVYMPNSAHAAAYGMQGTPGGMQQIPQQQQQQQHYQQAFRGTPMNMNAHQAGYMQQKPQSSFQTNPHQLPLHMQQMNINGSAQHYQQGAMGAPMQNNCMNQGHYQQQGSLSSGTWPATNGLGHNGASSGWASQSMQQPSMATNASLSHQGMAMQHQQQLAMGHPAPSGNNMMGHGHTLNNQLWN